MSLTISELETVCKVICNSDNFQNILEGSINNLHQNKTSSSFSDVFSVMLLVCVILGAIYIIDKFTRDE